MLKSNHPVSKLDSHSRSRTASPRNPQFLQQRIDAYYGERLDPDWNGEHLVVGGLPRASDIQLTSNDYLALAQHPDIVNAQIVELRRAGRGVMMSDVYSNGEGTLREFELELAAHAISEDAVVCQSGWCANLGLVQSIAGPGTPVYVDMFAHMSLWEGVRAADAKPIPFRHNCPESLERLIRKYGAGVILVDGVYSTSGSICPVADMARLAQQYGCVLVVDESHALGVFGQRGEGLVASLGLADRVHFRTASLSKAFCTRGGVVFGSSQAIKYFRYESRPAVFSSGVLGHEAAALQATLRIVQRGDERRRRMWVNAEQLRAEVGALGYNLDASECQIVSLVAGEEQRTRQLRDALEARGVFGSVFCWPATPRNKSLVRFSVNAALSRAQLERIVAVCAEIREEVGMADWVSTRRKAKAGRPARAAA